MGQKFKNFKINAGLTVFNQDISQDETWVQTLSRNGLKVYQVRSNIDDEVNLLVFTVRNNKLEEEKFILPVAEVEKILEN